MFSKQLLLHRFKRDNNVAEFNHITFGDHVIKTLVVDVGEREDIGRFVQMTKFGI